MAFVWKHPQSRYWMARFYDRDGKRRNRSTRIEATEKLRRKATKMAEEFEEAANRKRTARQTRKVIAELHEEITGEKLTSLTLRLHGENWLKRKKATSASSTYAFYKGAVSKLLTFLGEDADLDLAEITREHLTSFRDHEIERVAPRTVNHALKCVRMLFKDARKDGLISEDPSEFVETVRNKAASPKRPFTVEELKLLTRNASPEWHTMIMLGLYTAQRLADLAVLKWRNIDLERNEIRLSTRKTGRTQIIPISPPLHEHLKGFERPESPDSPLLPGCHDVMSRGGSGHLSNQFNDLLARLGLRKKKTHKGTGQGRGARREMQELSFHCLRATATTMLHDAGVPPSVVQELVGHDSEEVHRVYVKTGMDSIRKAAAEFPDITSG